METSSAFGPPTSPTSPPRHSFRTRLGGAVAAAMFGIGGFFAIQAVTHHSHVTPTGSGSGGPPGPPGGGFGGGPGGPAGLPGGFGGPPLAP